MTIFLKIIAKNRPNTGREPAVQNRFSGGQKTGGISRSRHYLNSVGPFLIISDCGALKIFMKYEISLKKYIFDL